MHSSRVSLIRIIFIILCTMSICRCQPTHCAIILGNNMKSNVSISQGYQETNLSNLLPGSFYVHQGCLLNICTYNRKDNCETFTNETNVAPENITSFSSFCFYDTVSTCNQGSQSSCSIKNYCFAKIIFFFLGSLQSR